MKKLKKCIRISTLTIPYLFKSHLILIERKNPCSEVHAVKIFTAAILEWGTMNQILIYAASCSSFQLPTKCANNCRSTEDSRRERSQLNCPVSSADRKLQDKKYLQEYKRYLQDAAETTRYSYAVFFVRKKISKKQPQMLQPGSFLNSRCTDFVLK